MFKGLMFAVHIVGIAVAVASHNWAAASWAVSSFIWSANALRYE